MLSSRFGKMAYETFKILIIDDDPNVLKIYTQVFERQHYEVISAMRGDEGLKKAFQEAPDIALVDIMMPDMNGYEICARLRAASATSDMPIMIVTALDATRARQQAAEMGADDFLNKDEMLKAGEGRIKMLIKRRILAHTRSWLADLPGSVAADYALRTRLEAGWPLAACYFDLNGLAVYNAYTGFEEGDQLLWKLARTLISHVRERGDFAGYYGLDDFIVLTVPEDAEALVRSIVSDFAQATRDISYNLPQGVSVPLLSAAIVIVESGSSLHPGQIGGTGQSLLREAKADPANPIRIARL
jgi:PleD family two-component response regulator